MSDLVVLTSNKGQGKRTATLLLEETLRNEGYRVACLVTGNGRLDVYSYLLEQRYHYSVPLEATHSKEAFERWVPTGYDRYILEVTFPYSPIGAAYIDLFGNINEVVSYDLRDTWEQHVLDPKNKAESIDPAENNPDVAAAPDLAPLWDVVHDRNVRTLVTKAPKALDGPYVDTAKVFHNLEMLAVESITPRMKLPKSSKKVIAVGEFPAEYWDIYPDLTWYQYYYAEFMQALRDEKYDLAVIGTCHNEALKFRDRPKDRTVVCYQPSVYLDLKTREKKLSANHDFRAVFSTIRTRPSGTPLGPAGGAFSGYNNRLWINTKHEVDEPLWRDGNVIFCDGWITPQVLLREKYLTDEGLQEA
ncbi:MULTISPECIES: hypothetical protein [unclassified Methanoculleus]|jgi:hypothetical protein|uniref:hypothetical protein n=2 Tax=Methanoculleus TaxID=45989 RepID=UPI0026013243|nr:hypothetical protein [Methanoculleus sp. UBA377]